MIKTAALWQHPLILCSLAAVFLCAVTSGASPCDDSLLVDSVAYPIPDHWCGKKLDSSAIARPKDLVRLPQELTFEEYRIYVLPETREAFVRMAAAAKRDGIDLIVDSGFRSPSFQLRLIRNRLKAGESIDYVLKSVAPPGYSQHHSGRAVDLVPSEARFAFTTTYKWLRENASRFGFIESLPEPKDDNNMFWEAWHWYYTGTH
ncbi:MAG: M15 family metallopeptidase [candidate division Zixibacteria bacterium]|nr:M15 family metallopeptidase [candidate division Zixibacteria bacterium]